jgi:hypothetical protein
MCGCIRIPPECIGLASSRARRPLSEVLYLHLDAVDVQIGNVDVPRLRSLRRQAARIDARAAVVEFVATVGQREMLSRSPMPARSADGSVNWSATRWTASPSRWMAPPALDHAGGENDAALTFIERRPDHQAGPQKPPPSLSK